MLGLLSKARHLRTSLGLSSNEREEYAFDPASGIPREEQKEILLEIEKLAMQSRISVSPEAFAVKAAKKGILFPVIVIVGAIVAAGAGFGIFSFLFQRGETQIAREDTSTITAEGKLIEQVKKESEARLQEKNQQIGQIQGRLAEIDRQRQDLQANMDAKVRDRESQLRAAMAAEMDAEKARLQKLGLTDQAIQKRLADLEAQKNEANAKDLESFRAKADEDRKKSEAALKEQQDRFNASLAQANAERQQVLSDSQQREADLQAQLAQKTQESESAQAKAQKQLEALTSQKQQEDLAAQQLVGLYAVAQADIAAKDYKKAITDLQAIGSYVDSADVMALSGMAKRRSVDLFIVDSLRTLVENEMAKEKIDTTSLVAASDQIAAIRAQVTEADAQLRAGQLAAAEKLYGDALAAIPEVSRSYAYFTTRAKGVENARVAALRIGLSQAEAAFDAGHYPEMLTAYKEALSYLPESSARLDKTLSNISSAGDAAVSQKNKTEQSRAAAPILSQGTALLKAGQLTDAVAQFLTVLSTYPLSAQAGAAARGISDATARLNAQSGASVKDQSDQVARLSDQLATFRTQLDASTAEILRIKKSVIGLLGTRQDPATTDSTALMSALNDRFGSLSNASSASPGLQAQLDAANQKNAQLSATLTRLNTDNARLTTELSAARDEAARQTALATQAQATQAPKAGSSPAQADPRLSAVDQKKLKEFQGLVASYVDYAKKEDANLARYDAQKALMLSLGSRDSFFASLGDFFDGLLGRVKRYEAQSSIAGIDTGRRGALDDVIELMTGLANQKSPDQQKRFLDNRLASEKDPKMKSVLGYLQRIVPAR
jgi:tetratricopeptide (TPR) repeat protein